MNSLDFDLETEWPELMKLLTPPQYFAIRRAIAAAWHEGWDPNLMDVELLVRYIRDEGELPPLFSSYFPPFLLSFLLSSFFPSINVG